MEWLHTQTDGRLSCTTAQKNNGALPLQNTRGWPQHCATQITCTHRLTSWLNTTINTIILSSYFSQVRDRQKDLLLFFGFILRCKAYLNVRCVCVFGLYMCFAGVARLPVAVVFPVPFQAWPWCHRPRLRLAPAVFSLPLNQRLPARIHTMSFKYQPHATQLDCWQ